MDDLPQLKKMEYFISYSDAPQTGKASPWFGATCISAEARKHEAYLAWAKARMDKAPDEREFFFMKHAGKPADVHLMASNRRRPWTLETPEALQVRCLGKGELVLR